MTDLTLRRAKGSELTHDEVDANFTKIHPTLRAILSSAIGNFWDNPRVRPIMPAPPVVTVGTSSAPSGFTRSFVYGAAGHPFAHAGGTPVTASGSTTFPVCTVSGSTKTQVYWRVSTILDGDEIAFLLSSATANGYRFLVDGQYVSMTGTVSGAGSARYYTLSFPSRGRRVITVEGQGALTFDQARVKFMDTLTAPRQKPSIYVVADSNFTANGENYDGDGAGTVIADHLGVRVDSGGAFGTGFVANDSGTKNNYAARRTDWTTTSPDALIFFISVNDYLAGPSTATLKTAIATELTQARSALGPQVPIIVFAECLTSREYYVSISALATVEAYETAAQEAVDDQDDPYIVFVPAMNAVSPGPMHGINNTDGNLYGIYNNGTNHLNAEGYKWWGMWLSHQIVRVLADMAGVEVPEFAPMPSPATITVSADGWSERRLTADEARTNDTSVQNWFASAASVPLLANSTYEFEGTLFMTQGATSSGLNQLFASLSGASIQWEAIGAKVNQTTQATALRMAMSNTFNTARNVTTASTVTGSVVKVRGSVRTTTSGSLTPQFSQTAASGSVSVLAGTFFKTRRVGANTFNNSGDWA